MSTFQTLTLIGLYNYDSTLFDSLVLPDGYDKNDFINALLLEHGEKCVLYTNPNFMKFAIGAWGRKWAGNLERIYTALTEEYNPLHNYDRFEEYSDTEGRTATSTSNAGHNATDTPDYTMVNDTNENATTERLTSAFNSSGYEPSEKTIENGGKTTTKTSGKTQNLTENSNSTTNDNESRTLTHNAHLYGNIGVTTSAQMLTGEVDVRMKYNLYDAAGRLFANELLIGLY